MKVAAFAFAATIAMHAAPKELRFSISGDPVTFDPLKVSESNAETIRYLTGGVLVRVDRVTDRLQPGLAESWKVLDGGRGIAFHLRQGLKFSDGSPLDSSDVVRTLNRALDPKEACPVGDSLREGSVSPAVAAAGPLDITLRYPAPKAGLERLLDGVAIARQTTAKLPPTAGPYFVSEYRPGDFLRLVRNPHYWKRDDAGRQLPYIDSIRIDIQQNHDIETARFLRGEFQLIGSLDPDSFERIAKAVPAAARSLGASLDSEFLWFNQAPAKSLPEWKRVWFRSKVFRNAVSGAIHRDDIARIVYRNHAHPAAGPVSPANKYWFNAELKPRAADPQASLRLLASEGFTLRSGVLRDRDGHAVEFSLATNSDNRARERMASLIRDDLRAIGIQVNIVTLEFNSLLERMTRSLNYEAVLLGFKNVDPDPSEETNVWLSSGAQHAWWPSEKKPATPWEARIDELEAAQASTGRREERRKSIYELERIVADQEPIVYLVNPDYLCAISPALHGVQPTVYPPQILWNVEWLRLE